MPKTPIEMFREAEKRVSLPPGVYTYTPSVTEKGRIYFPYLEELLKHIIDVLEEECGRNYFDDNPKDNVIRLELKNNFAAAEKNPSLTTRDIIKDLKDVMQKRRKVFLYLFDVSENYNGIIFKTFDKFFDKHQDFINKTLFKEQEKLRNAKLTLTGDPTNTNVTADLKLEVALLQNAEQSKKIDDLTKKVNSLMEKDHFKKQIRSGTTNNSYSNYQVSTNNQTSVETKREEENITRSISTSMST